MSDSKQSTKISLGKAPKGLSSLGSGIKFPSAAHATRVQEVAEQISSIKLLINTVNQLETKLLNLAAKQTPDLTKEEATLWQAATQEIGTYLRQPVQVASDKKPLPLESTLDLLTSWVNAFEQNLAVDGVGLQEDEERLESFSNKISTISAMAAKLNETGQTLLRKDELNQVKIEKQITSQQKAAAQDRNRVEAIDKLLSNFYKQWEAQVANLEADLASLKKELSNLPANTHPVVKKQAQAGLAQLNSINTDKLIGIRTQLGQWINKYRDDKTFTAGQLNKQLNAELIPLMTSYQQAAQKIKDNYSPQTLTAKQLAKDNQVKNELKTQIKEILTQQKTQLDELTKLRQEKLGREPDERYFGAIAKAVNDQISSLKNLVEQTTALETNLNLTASFKTNLDNISTQTKTVIKNGEQFSNPEKLTKLLEASWQQASINELNEIIASATKDLAQVKNKLDELAMAKESLGKISDLEAKLEQALTQGHDLIETPTSEEEFIALGEEIEEDAAELRSELIKLSQQPKVQAVDQGTQAITVKTDKQELIKPDNQQTKQLTSQEEAEKKESGQQTQQFNKLPVKIKNNKEAINKPENLKKTEKENQVTTETTTEKKDQQSEEFNELQAETTTALNEQLRSDLEIGLKHFKLRLKTNLEYFKKLEAYNKDWASDWYERIKNIVDQPIIAGEKITLNQLLTEEPTLNTNQLQFAQLAVSNQGPLALLLKEIENFSKDHPLKKYDEQRQELQSLFGKIGQRERLIKSRQVQLSNLKQQEISGKPTEIANYGQKITKLEKELNQVSKNITKLKREVSELKDFHITNPRFANLFNSLNERLDELVVPELTLPAITTNKIKTEVTSPKTNLADQRSMVEKLVL